MAELLRWTLFVICLSLLGIPACARGAPAAAVNTGMRNLKCSRAEVETVLNRKTPKVEEYVIACNFMYTRVQCSDNGCRSAPLRPPCVGDACFEEDPVTLDWKLKSAVASSAKSGDER